MSSPRSLADDLRGRDDAAIARLLRMRPDLLHPVPPDITALASRATAGPSLSRCLDILDALHLHVLRIVATRSTEGPASADDLIELALQDLPSDADDACRAALENLRDRALVWGSPEALRAVAAAADLVASVGAPAWPAPGVQDVPLRDVTEVDSHAGLRARETVALTRDLIDAWSIDPPTVLRSGGLAVRDFAAARSMLHANWSRAALTIEVAQAARLVADDEEERPNWVPTDLCDGWLEASPAAAWILLVDGWLTLPRLPSLADAKSRLLTSEHDRRAVIAHRRAVLDLLAEQPPGTALDAVTLLQILDHRRPRQSSRLREQVVTATLQEAEEIGLLGFGALSTAARILLQPHARGARERSTVVTEVAAALAEAMPPDVDHVLIQGDLTITAPGPLTAVIARRLTLLADTESRGHATVYRVSESSIRRALDAGMDAEGIHAFLADISRTPVPQALSYLVDDVARRHGAVRVGTGLAYLRCDAPETLSLIVEDRRLASLGLHRIAPTVLISAAPTSEVIPALRAAGYAPAAEDPSGGLVIRRPEDRRVRAPRAASTITARAPEETLINAAVRTLRAGDRAQGPRTALVVGPATGAGAPRLTSTAIATSLRHAIAENQQLWVGYADTDGGVIEQIIDPIRLSAGVLTAFDHRMNAVRTFAVSRITGIADVAEADAP
jgi:Helicase conserved C-terminal domain